MLTSNLIFYMDTEPTTAPEGEETPANDAEEQANTDAGTEAPKEGEE